jgi:hypothetical protein
MSLPLPLTPLPFTRALCKPGKGDEASLVDVMLPPYSPSTGGNQLASRLLGQALSVGTMYEITYYVLLTTYYSRFTTYYSLGALRWYDVRHQRRWVQRQPRDDQAGVCALEAGADQGRK